MSEKRLEILEEMADNLIQAVQLGDLEWISNIAHLLEMELYEIRAEKRLAELKRKAG
ncbi:hypothetical protein [Staphylospora marina]|uniref:hypothetical protein n=1 Tax=Staphylospora marina TaxID=2490858 RepID=UPI0013DE2EA9|nr:hypothetical protein [Staphylospora marina]